MSIGCERAREVVLGRPQLAEASDEMFRARHHVELCDLCRQYLAKENHWQRAWRTRQAMDAAPASLKLRLERVLTRNGRSRRPMGWFRRFPGTTGWKRRGIAAALAAGIAIAATIAWNARESRRVSIAEELIGEFVLNLPQATEIVGSSPEDLVVRAERELGVRIDPPQMQGMRIESAKICSLMQRAAALIHYKGEGHACSLYVFNDPGLSLAEWQPGATGKPVYYSYSKRNVNVVMWRQGTLVYTLVSSTSPEQMVAMMK